MRGARVLINNLATGYELLVLSSEVGIFAAQQLTVGHYKLTVEAAGFKTATASDVELNAGPVVRVDFKLQMGERSYHRSAAHPEVQWLRSARKRILGELGSIQERLGDFLLRTMKRWREAPGWPAGIKPKTMCTR